MANEVNLSFAESVLKVLRDNERTNRWLIGKLKDKGIDLTDTQLSNRIKEIHPFKEDEISFISEILGI